MDAAHGVEHVYFSNCVFDGITLQSTRGLATDDFVRDIHVVDRLPALSAFPRGQPEGRTMDALTIDNGDPGYFAFAGDGLTLLRNAESQGGTEHRFSKLGWGHAAVYTPNLSGEYEILVHWGKHQDVATRVPWTVKSTERYTTRTFDQNNSAGWHSLGSYQLDSQSWVRLADPHYLISNGPVIADAVHFRRIGK